MRGASSPAAFSRAGDHDFSQDDARESELARAAAAGDGQAFASLYETYEKRIYNYCLRLLGGSSDAEDATQEAFLKVFDRLPDLDGDSIKFGAYLFTAARNASYDMIDRRRRTEPVADLPDDGSGHLHRERADADIEPERAAMLSNQQASVRAANERLPARQREVLALREVEGMSYTEIASTMEMNSNSVAQLISRARTSLRNELHLGVASAVAPASVDCGRALPLMAMKQDGELADPGDRGWLSTHLSGCPGCRVSSEEMAEAGISYRAWTPIGPGLYLFRDTLAKAADSIGTDWSGIERPAGSGGGPGPGTPASTSGFGGRLRTMMALGAALFVGILVGVTAERVAESSPETTGTIEAVSSESGNGPRGDGGGNGGGGGGNGSKPGVPSTEPTDPSPPTATPVAPPVTDGSVPTPESGGGESPTPSDKPGGNRPPGDDSPANPPGSPTPPTPVDPPREPTPIDPRPVDPGPTGPGPTTPPRIDPPLTSPTDPKNPLR